MIFIFFYSLYLHAPSTLTGTTEHPLTHKLIETANHVTIYKSMQIQVSSFSKWSHQRSEQGKCDLSHFDRGIIVGARGA